MKLTMTDLITHTVYQQAEAVRAFYMGELGNYMTSSGTLTKKTRFLLENLSLIS